MPEFLLFVSFELQQNPSISDLMSSHLSHFFYTNSCIFEETKAKV